MIAPRACSRSPEGPGRVLGAWKEDGSLDGLCGRMENKGAVTMISAAFVATGRTLATDGAFLIALEYGACQAQIPRAGIGRSGSRDLRLFSCGDTYCSLCSYPGRPP